ncbi:hypothetical protein J1P26_20455 [Neobacillus sp. MM2021_6]|uniref:hypothetical protein n=1 Tax=Bacillaceae TaxID=186817 RepID=UPI0014098B6C|nr:MULTISPECIES: hypothetical protein [Bacillaceae]MBO0962082.1 hypothetical protein [Neobacillus sp. MM2021_6]NHC19989.1 hypothetical protein [Bacillus sp. MM2020_4]
MKIPKRNRIPFFILFLIHIFLMGLTFYRNKNRKETFILLVSTMGFAYLFEYFVLNLFNAYIYKPKVLKKPILDNVFGAVLSQAIFIPFTAVFLTLSKSGWVAKIFSSIYFSLIEMLFLWLRVYKHNWWKTIYTFILLPFYFKWCDFWYSCLRKKNQLVQFASFFLLIMVTETNLFFMLAIIRKFRFGMGRYHSWREHFILSPLYSITISAFTAISLKNHNNVSTKLKVIILGTGLNYFFQRIKLLKNKLRFFEYLLIRIVMVYVYGQYREWVYGERDGG